MTGVDVISNFIIVFFPNRRKIKFHASVLIKKKNCNVQQISVGFHILFELKKLQTANTACCFY